MEISAIDTMWVLFGTMFIFFMHSGFALLETGFSRVKNSSTAWIDNLLDFAIASLVFWAFGYGIMFGNSNPFIGEFNFVAMNSYPELNPTIPSYANVMFHGAICATTAAVVSGAMLERVNFKSFLIYSTIISGFVYPVVGHWAWSEHGWLYQLGFHDFAGSTAVHMCGGVAALIGAKILGPRIGKYDKDGKPKAILGHSLTLGALGVFILWFCWFGFNGCSTVAMDSDEAIYSAGNIFVTTNLAAAVATVAVMIITWIRYKKPDISMTLNGSLAGLVAVTAGCDVVTPTGAFFIGLIAAFVVVFGIEFVDQVLKIDDPVGAVGVHCFCGAVGTLLTGLFDKENGVFYGGGFHMLGIQLLGVVSVILWVTITMVIVFNLLKHTIGLRASVEEETKGLDVTEHNLASSYADFMPVVFTGREDAPAVSAAPVSVEKSVPVEHFPQSETTISGNGSGAKLTKVVMIFNQSRFVALKEALTELGVTGMTITQVMGCGTQKGHTNYYRGIKVEEAALLPKIKLEVVVSKVPVADVIALAKKVLYTGHIGDGKIFVYDVENVVKVRTGEEGYDALQGD